ncbi:hypothetical protein V0288_15650 [Pannus brasiliensis CCIBt3594]|uniref:Galectin n=1 Tax=Pannus brasiliensis CCIBt3594 TaxID=1427578 RepID=A0AAW9QUF4_9CHRO
MGFYENEGFRDSGDRAGLLSVVIVIGEEPQTFTFSRHGQRIGEIEIFITNEDEDFARVFLFNQHIAGEVMKLVDRVYNGEEVKFPIELGDFGTKEEALALQKPFER